MLDGLKWDSKVSYSSVYLAFGDNLPSAGIYIFSSWGFGMILHEVHRTILTS